MKESRYNMKRGISLITLIITIIVIIILAGAIILSLNNTNIIENANKSVELSDISNIKEKINLINLDLKVNTAINSKEYNSDLIIKELKKEMKIKEENVKGNLLITNDDKYGIMVKEDNKVEVVNKSDAYVDAKYLDEADESLFETVDNPDGTVTITKYNGNEVSVKIPSTIGGKNVSVLDSKKINQSVFPKENLKSVILPKTLKKLGDNSFCRNKLTSLEIPNGVTNLGFACFSNNQLKSIEIPNGVTIIEGLAFAYNQLTSVKISSSVTSIGTNAFAYNQLTNLEIPNGVITIGSYAFKNNQLTNLKIPNSVTSIEDGAFNNNKLPENQAYIYARKANGEEDKTKLMSYGGYAKAPVIIEEVTKINKFSFEGSNIEEIVIPSNVIEIGRNAFMCKNLKKVEFKGNVPSKLGYWIFEYNKNLKIKVPQDQLDAYKMAKGKNEDNKELDSVNTWFLIGTWVGANLNAFCTEF